MCAGVIVKQLLKPTVQIGGKITVQSDLTPACGGWTINKLDLDLESNVYNGQWFATMYASRIGVQPGAVP